jgi:hypothetical protein
VNETKRKKEKEDNAEALRALRFAEEDEKLTQSSQR